MNKRGQVSIEYLIMTSFIIFLVIGILGISLFYSNLVRDNIKINHLKNFANKIISSSERVFYAGEPSLTTINAYLPSGVSDISIRPLEIIFNISTSSGTNIISFESNVPIQGSIASSEGVKRIKISAGLNNVTIEEL